MLNDLRDFLTAIFAHSASGLCGSAAAGLVIASPFVEPAWAQTVFLAGAAAACLGAGFMTWRRERRNPDAGVREQG